MLNNETTFSLKAAIKTNPVVKITLEAIFLIY